jgi:hypothetical protein
MARGERQEDGTRGGVGTITRTGDRRARDQAARDQGGRDQAAQDQAAQDQAPQDQAGQPVAPASPGAYRLGRPARPVPAPRTVPTDPRRGDPRRAGSGGAPWRVPPAQRPGAARPEQPEPGAGATQAAAGTRLRPSAPTREQGLPAVAGPHRMPFVLLLCGLLGGALVSALVISTTLAEGSFEITKLQTSTSSLARERQALEDQVAQAQSAPVIAAKAAKLGMREISELRFIDLKNGKITTDAGIQQSYIPGYLP